MATYLRLTLPEQGQSFALIHSIEDPDSSTPFSKRLLRWVCTLLCVWGHRHLC